MTVAYGVSHAQQRSDDGGERFFGYMDRNRDGKLDSEEIQRMPSSFRDQFAKSGVRLDRGLTKDEFMRAFPQAMEEMRAQRDRSRDDDRGRNDDDRRRDDERRREEYRRQEEERNRGQNPQQTAAAKKVEYYTPRKAQSITVGLPSQFSEADADLDGQIGLYEWRKWKPEARNEFRLRDQNGDGFLTPRELLQPLPQPETTIASSDTNSGTPASAETPTEVRRDDSSDNSRRSGRDRGSRDRSRRDSDSNAAPQNAPTTAAAPAEAPVVDRRVNTARFIFGTLDADKDEIISPDEFNSSRTVKPKFEAAGIDLTQPMNQEQFIASFLKAY